MVKIDNESQYYGALKRMEELMLSLPEGTLKDDLVIVLGICMK